MDFAVKLYIPINDDFSSDFDKRSLHTSLCLDKNPENKPPIYLDKNTLLLINKEHDKNSSG